MIYIGIDVGGMSIKAGLVDAEGNILFKHSCPTGVERGYGAVIRDIAQLGLDTVQKSGHSMEEVKSIGIGIPGIMDQRTGIVPFCTNLAWHDVPIIEEMKQYTNLPVYVDNDATVAGLAESVRGVSAGTQNSVFVTLGTGVGGGVVTDGKLFVGGRGLGAELGHMVLAMEGETCGCGMHGCIEAYCSVTSLVKQTTRAMAADPASAMHEYAKKAGLVDGRTAFECSKMGDKSAIQVVETYCRYLANAIGSLATCFHPDAVLIGGGLSNQREYLMDKLNALLPRYVFAADVIGVPPILRASLGNDAGTIGAAYLDKM